MNQHLEIEIQNQFSESLLRCFVSLCNTSLDLSSRRSAAARLQYVDLSQSAWQKPRVSLNFFKSLCTVLFHVSPHFLVQKNQDAFTQQISIQPIQRKSVFLRCIFFFFCYQLTLSSALLLVIFSHLSCNAFN